MAEYAQTQCWICPVCKDDHDRKIECSTRIQIGLAAEYFLLKIQDTPKRVDCYLPYGLGVFRYEGDDYNPPPFARPYVAFDNSTGQCWIEEFKDINEAFRWLKGDFEISDEVFY